MPNASGALAAIAIVPSAPLLVPELASGAAPESTELRAAVVAAAGALPDRWVVVGAGPADDVIGPQSVGSFGGYGVEVPVALGPDTTAAPRRLPLCALIAGWVREQVNPQASAEVRVYAAGHGADAAADIGRTLRARIDAGTGSVGVLIVADGANTLTASAPGGYDASSVPVQEALDDALSSGDSGALAELGPGIVGRVPFQVLAGLVEPAPAAAHELYRGAPYGVGYFVGVWVPAGRSAATGESIPAGRSAATGEKLP